MSKSCVRPMTAADIDAVMAIAAGHRSAPHWPRPAYEVALDPAAAPRRIALVAEVSGVVGGFTIASLIPPQAELETIAVAAAFIRQKSGSALLSALLRELNPMRIEEITLEVRASNLAAHAFYLHHSFAPFAVRKGYYPDTGEDAILMRAILPIQAKIN